MRKSRISVIAIAAASVLFAAGAAAGTVTGHHGSSGPAGPMLKVNQVHQQVTAAAHKLKDTVIAAGFSGVSLTAGSFTPIDVGEVIHCNATGPCTLEADMSVQAEGVGTGDAWAICLYVVDLGTYATCPYYGNLDSTFFENGTQIESLTSLPAGAHTVQTQVYTAGGGSAFNYSLTYHAYKP